MADLAPGESVLMRKLLLGKRQKLDRKYHQQIKKAIDAHKRSLKNDYERIYFQTNSAYFLIGGLLSAALFLAMVTQVADSLFGAVFSLIALTVVGLSGGKSLLALSVMFPAAGGGKATSWAGGLASCLRRDGPTESPCPAAGGPGRPRRACLCCLPPFPAPDSNPNRPTAWPPIHS